MAERICPRCGSRNTAPILWGMPAFDEELAVKIAKNDIFLGGCCVGINDPTFHCYKCKKDFGHPAHPKK